MVKKNPPKDNSPEFDRERGFKVLLEEINGNVKTIAEGQVDLNQKYHLLYEEAGRQREDIFIIKTDVRFLKEGQKRLEEGVKELNGKFNIFDKRLTNLEAASQ